MHNDTPLPASWCLQHCSALFRRLCDSLWLPPSLRLAVVSNLSLVFPERLVWNRNKQGAFLGEKLLNECKDESFVLEGHVHQDKGTALGVLSQRLMVTPSLRGLIGEFYLLPRGLYLILLLAEVQVRGRKLWSFGLEKCEVF